MSLDVVFMGTPEFSVPSLRLIIAAGHRVKAVYTQPPRPAGRGMAERKSPVHLCAEEHGIPVATPRTLRNAEAQQAFSALGAEVAVVVAYGLILPVPVLEAPRHGCLNLHASKLPRWRGAAPIQRAVMAGDDETAAMVMRMEEGLDTGTVCLSKAVAIGPDMTAGELHDVLAEGGAQLLVRALEGLEAGTLRCVPQPEDGVTYARKIEKAESRIDLVRDSSAVHDHIRGLSPFPGAWLEAGPEGKGERIKILRSQLVGRDGTLGAPGEVLDGDLTIACGRGAVRLIELQRAGKKPMSAAELLRGFALPPGSRLR